MFEAKNKKRSLRAHIAANNAHVQKAEVASAWTWQRAVFVPGDS